MDFSNFNPEQFLGMGEDSNPILWVIWIIPIIIFVFYGQRIQLQITSGEIKKNISKLKQFKDETRTELIDYIKKLNSSKDPAQKIDRFIDYFTIMPVDMDPNGIIPKIRHVIRSREDQTRAQVKSLFSEISDLERTKVQTILEVVTSLQLLYKIVNHFYLTAKKQKNYPLILPLQMMLPFIMEEANALHDAMPALKQGQPIGDGIGPMVVGKMMLGHEKQKVAFETVWSESEHEGRKLVLLKAEGPSATVGRPGDAIEELVSKNKPDAIVMIDASLKLEGEDSATVAQGFGAAIGGIGTDRFQIEEVAIKHNIPVFAIVIKQSIKEAITLMTKEIADKAEEVRSQVYDMIKENTTSGQSVLVVGVGNTLGVSQ
ncbi:MAG: hypothetical protein NPMRD1_180022 [Nitrosopumilales archaeon]|nr:MAG: hypothetical protein NPMRD1_180022 [Nitrosopumilales archaeon]